MKFKSSSSSANPHPLLLRWLTFLVVGFILFIPILFEEASSPYKGQTRYSRVYYLSPDMYNSKSKIKNLDLSRFDVNLLEPIDNRTEFYGEYFHNGTKIEPASNFFSQPETEGIRNKISSDMNNFGANRCKQDDCRPLVIKTTIDVFYPNVKGYGWLKAYAKVGLGMTASLGDSTIINKKYQSYYSTGGLDKNYEGGMVGTIEPFANITLGVTLRKTLDQFYADLAKKLPADKMITVEGIITDAHSGAGVGATITLKADKEYTTTSTFYGTFSISVPRDQVYTVDVQASGFADKSETFRPGGLISGTVEKDFKLRPVETLPGIELKKVLFNVGSAEWLKESQADLDEIAELLKINRKVDIELDGFADNQGDMVSDYELSLNRAKVIKSYLVHHGIKAHRIKTKAFGATKLISKNHSEESHRLNRRVEFVMVHKSH